MNKKGKSKEEKKGIVRQARQLADVAAIHSALIVIQPMMNPILDVLQQQ